MRRLIYQLFLWLLLPVLLLATIHQSIKRKGGRLFILQRFGFSLPELPVTDYWFHCASVGEVNAALPLIQSIFKQQTDAKILITSNTPSSKSILTPQLNKQLHHSYLPLDYSFAIRNLLRAINAKKLFVMETEIWPNLFHQCANKSINIDIINARLSVKTLSAPTFILSLYRTALSHCQQILCQSSDHAKHFAQLVEHPEIKTVGNLKTYTRPIYPKEILPFTEGSQRPIVALISSHEDEELKVIKALHKAITKAPPLLLIIPRHPERSTTLQQQFQKAGYSYAVRSKNDKITENTQIYLADTLGEVPQLITNSEFCIIGGSFIPHGGQNFLEATALSKAVICGPHMHNFQTLYDTYLSHKAIIASDIDNLPKHLQELYHDNQYRDQVAKRALSLCSQQKYIIDDYLNLIL